MVDEILLNETRKVGAVNHEAPNVLENDYNKNELYQVENMSLDKTKEKLTEVSVRLNTNFICD